MKLQFDIVLVVFLGIKNCLFMVNFASAAASSIARGRLSLPISLSMKMLNKENTTFLALLKLFLFCTEMDYKEI